MSNSQTQDLLEADAGLYLDMDELDAAASKTLKSFTWTGRNSYSFRLLAYTIQSYLKEISDDLLEIKLDAQIEFVTDHGKTTPVMSCGLMIHTIKGSLVSYSANNDSCSLTIRSNRSIDKLVAELKNRIALKNTLRNKHLQIVPSGESFRAVIKPVPSINFDGLISDSRMVEDIYDNTIYQLKHTKHNNGIIFHGEPGTGKSLMCQAIVHEAIKEGFTTCYMTGMVNFSEFNQFVTSFLTPCVIILEDIDSFAGSRENGDGKDLADFLQFLSGVTERHEQMIVIATTNYLDQLDKAIKSRPVRFNRKYYFPKPGNSEIDKLLDLYFPDCVLGVADKSLCHGKEFSGAHISEIRRTADTLARKRQTKPEAVFKEAVQMVEEHFAPSLKKIGF